MKKAITLFVIFSILTGINGTAQVPTWQWAKSSAGSANESSNGVCMDANGNTFVTGSYSSSTITFGSTTFTNTGGLDMFLVKYDPAGNVLWAKSGKGVSNEGGYNVAVDPSGNAYVVGTYNSSTFVLGTTTLTLNSYDDIFILKYDPSGNLIWAKTAGGSGNDIGQSIAVDAGGNAYITGYYASGSISFGSSTLTNSGGNDLYVVKYDPSGNVLWANKAGGSSNDSGNGIAVDASGNVFITGSFSSSGITFGTTTFSNGGGIDMFTVKYNTSGNVIWAKTATGVSNDVGYNIALDGTGNPYVVGTYNSSTLTFSTTVLALKAFDDIFIVKYDPSGNLFWARTIGGTGNDIGQSIAVDATGNAYITGYFASTSMVIGTTTLTNIGSNDFYMAEYDASGAPQWANSEGGALDDRGSCITVESNGNNIYVGGYFASSTINFGSTTLTNAGGNDMYIAKFGGLTAGVKEENDQAGTISVFPNPNNGNFQLKVAEDQNSNFDAQIVVSNTLGQIVYEAKQNSPIFNIAVQNAGIYYVTIKKGAQMLTKKVVVN
ncbi:MAG: SBBP repeat-containing protein [Bacteroidia bacterium]